MTPKSAAVVSRRYSWFSSGQQVRTRRMHWHQMLRNRLGRPSQCQCLLVLSMQSMKRSWTCKTKSQFREDVADWCLSLDDTQPAPDHEERDSEADTISTVGVSRTLDFSQFDFGQRLRPVAEVDLAEVELAECISLPPAPSLSLSCPCPGASHDSPRTGPWRFKTPPKFHEKTPERKKKE